VVCQIQSVKQDLKTLRRQLTSSTMQSFTLHLKHTRYSRKTFIQSHFTTYDRQTTKFCQSEDLYDTTAIKRQCLNLKITNMWAHYKFVTTHLDCAKVHWTLDDVVIVSLFGKSWINGIKKQVCKTLKRHRTEDNNIRVTQ